MKKLDVHCDVQVYSCDSKLVVYKDSCKAGILELQGSNGEKAYCFFLSRVSSSFLADVNNLQPLFWWLFCSELQSRGVYFVSLQGG